MIPFVNIHTHNSNQSDDELIIRSILLSESELYGGFCSVGIHPWYINEAGLKEELFQVEKLIQMSNVLAVGECGLDRLINTSYELQKSVFIEQLKIAEKYKKPVIIHCVKAFDDLIQIKKKLNLSVPFIVHGFNNNQQTAEQLLKNGFYLSFGKALLNGNSNASKIINNIPLQRLFLETDDTGFKISVIFEKAAFLLNMELDQLKEFIYFNFKNTFKHYE